MIITLLIMIVLTILGIAAIMTSSIETKISGNVKALKKAFYAAEAGVERFKTELRGNSDWMKKKDNTTAWPDPVFNADLGDGSNYKVTVQGSTKNTITVRSQGTFRDSTVKIEARFDKGSLDKVLIADKDITIGRDSGKL